VDACFISQAVVSILPYYGMQIVARVVLVEKQQTAFDQLIQASIELLLTLKRVQGHERLVTHRTSKCRQPTEQLALWPLHRLVGDLQNVMFLFAPQFRRDRIARSHLNISGPAVVLHNHPCEKP
jgi:hypothetical protein